MNPEELQLRSRKEVRLHRFGILAGLAISIILHVILLEGPNVKYRPAMEEAKYRKTLVAKPYRPKVDTPKPPDPEPPKKIKEEPKPKQPEKIKQPELAPPVQVKQDPGKPTLADAPRKVVESKGDTDNTDALFSDIMAQLESRGAEIESSKARAEQGEGGPGEGDTKAGDSYLDSRVRVSVVSYPETTASEQDFIVRYPDKKFTRKELQVGTCRVWYRVWTDSSGDIVRKQIKTPSDSFERDKFSAFIKEVEKAIDSYKFDAVKAEVHFDVLFTIE